MYNRILKIEKLALKKSFFFIGPRQTGKSTLLRELEKDALFINLLKGSTFLQLANDPSQLEDMVRNHLHAGGRPLVIIDEVQKLPILLDETHRLLEEHKQLRFVLTGSSGRKLRRQGVNLLGGRAGLQQFFPLVSAEIESDLFAPRKDPMDLVRFGGLPSVLTAEDPQDVLNSYVGVYLQEEILAEGLARSVHAFSSFIKFAAQANGEQLNMNRVASDCGLPSRTVREYFQILEDTFLGYLLPCFSRTVKRKPMSIPKFYFFDVGVANSLLGKGHIIPGTPDFGRALEHLVFCELRALIGYNPLKGELFYWRSESKQEVDFVYCSADGKVTAIEVKGAGKVSSVYFKGLLAFEEDQPCRKIIVCDDPFSRMSEEGVEIIPWRDFLNMIWDGGL